MGKSKQKKSEAVTGLGLGLGMLTLADQVRRELGVSDELFHRLATEDGREDWKRLFTGMSDTTSKKHLIDCDTLPFIPEGWEVVEHQKGGTFEWDPSKVELYLCAEQQEGSIEGHELRKKLEGKPVMNACLLDYLLKHPELIPEEWKGKYVFFWGTIYLEPIGDLFVRCLYWGGGGWDWDGFWLGNPWRGSNPAALCK